MDGNKEIIGTFFVVNEAGDIKPAVVSQEIVTHYTRDHTAKGKFINLYHIDGPEVLRTGDPKIFKLLNGELLRKTKEPTLM